MDSCERRVDNSYWHLLSIWHWHWQGTAMESGTGLERVLNECLAAPGKAQHSTSTVTVKYPYPYPLPIRIPVRTCTGLHVHDFHLHPSIHPPLDAAASGYRRWTPSPSGVRVDSGPTTVHSRATLDIMAPFFVLGKAESTRFSACQSVRPNAIAVDRGPPFREACSGCSATWSAEHHRVKQ